MADDYQAGSAYVPIRPDFSGFHQSIKKQLAGTSSDFAKAGADAGKAFSEGFKRNLGDPFGPLRAPDQTAPGARSAGQFARAFRDKLTEAFRNLPDAKIDADSSPADRKIAEIRAQLKELSTKRIGVDITDTEALATVKTLQAELDKLARKAPSVRLKVDAAAASAELAAFRAEVDGAGRDSGSFSAALRGAQGSMSGLVLAGLAFGPALLPVLAAATYAAVGFGVALAAAGAAAGAFALAALPGITKVRAALAAQKTAATSTAGSYASSVNQIKSAEEQVTVAQQNAQQAQQALSAARVQARKDAVDLANSVVDAELNERSAVLSVAEARQALLEQDQQTAAAEKALANARSGLANAQANAATVLADPNSTAAQKAAAQAAVAAARAALTQAKDNARDQVLAQKRAVLAVAQSIQALKEQRIETKRLQDQEAASNKAGISGDKNVIAARRALQAADRQLADAERSLAQARAGTGAASGVAAAAVAKLTGPEQMLLQTWKQLTSVYDRWAAGLERPVFGVLTAGLRDAGKLLPTLTPFVLGAARGFGTLERQASRALAGPFWQSFARSLARLSGKSIIGLGHALGNVATGVAGLAKRAEPFTIGLLGSVDRLTARFAKWGTGGSNGFSRFLTSAKKDAVPVGKFITALVKALPNILRGLNPLAPVSLAIATALTSLIAQVPPSVITAFAVAFLAWKLGVAGLPLVMTAISVATKIWAAAQWILDAALNANPISLIIIGIAALIAIIVVIATKTRWFQDAWRVAWGFIKAVAVDAWSWIKTHWPLLVDILGGPIAAAVLYIVRHWSQVKAAFADAWSWVKSHWPLLVDILGGPIAAATLYIVRHWTAIKDGASIAWHAIVAAFDWAVGQIRRYAADIWGIISGVFSHILHGAADAFGWIPGIGGQLHGAANAFDRFRQNVNNALRGINGRHVNVDVGFAPTPTGKRGGIPGLAAGGLVRGPGGPTDDRAGLYRLSSSEYVHKASAVAKYGVGFMHAVNNGTYPAPGMAAGGIPGGATSRPGVSLTAHAPGEPQLQSAVWPPVVKLIKQLFSSGTGGVFTSAIGRAIADYGMAFIGKAPYLWGGTTPAGWDCSGFTSWVYDHFGFGNIPRTAAAQQQWVQPTAFPAVGGLAFFAGADGTASRAGHVGIIVGANKMVDAYGTGFGTRIDSITGSSGAIGGFGVPPGAHFDQGGWLPPGYTTAFNGTGKPEAVLTAQQWDTIAAAVKGGDGERHEHYHIGEMVGGTVEAKVRAGIAAANVAQRRKLRTGRRK